MIAKTRFHLILEKKVADVVGINSEQMMNGGLKDYSEYKYAAGYIAGLKAALSLCDEIEREVDLERGSPSRGD